MKNLVLPVALMLSLAASAAAKAVPGPDATPRDAGTGVQTANPAGICDRLHEYGSPAWQACRAQFYAGVTSHCDKLHEYGSPQWQACRNALLADAASLLCGREPQLSICQRGQQLLSAAEQTRLVASASLICGREPQLSICKRGQQILSAADPSLICGYEPQLSICRRGQQVLSEADQLRSSSVLKVSEATQLRSSSVSFE